MAVSGAVEFFRRTYVVLSLKELDLIQKKYSDAESRLD